jgi:hypothetical protein
MPDHGVEPIGTPTPGGALLGTPTHQRCVPLADITERCLCLADAQVSGAGHPQPACAPSDEAPPEVAARGRLRHVPGEFGVAVPLDLRFLTQLGREHSRGIAPHPLGCRAVAAPGVERAELGFIISCDSAAPQAGGRGPGPARHRSGGPACLSRWPGARPGLCLRALACGRHSGAWSAVGNSVALPRRPERGTVRPLPPRAHSRPGGGGP